MRPTTYHFMCPCRDQLAHFAPYVKVDEPPLVGDVTQCTCSCVHRAESVDLESLTVVVRRMPISEQIEAMRAGGLDVVSCTCPHCGEVQFAINRPEEPIVLGEGGTNIMQCPDCGGPFIAFERVDNELAVRIATREEVAEFIRAMTRPAGLGDLLDALGQAFGRRFPDTPFGDSPFAP